MLKRILSSFSSYLNVPSGNSNLGVIDLAKKIWEENPYKRQERAYKQFNEELRSFTRSEVSTLEKTFKNVLKSANTQQLDINRLAENETNEIIKAKLGQYALPTDKETINKIFAQMQTKEDTDIPDIPVNQELVDHSFKHILSASEKIGTDYTPRTFTPAEMKQIFKESLRILNRLSNQLPDAKMESMIELFDYQRYLQFQGVISEENIQDFNNQVNRTHLVIKSLASETGALSNISKNQNDISPTDLLIFSPKFPTQTKKSFAKLPEVLGGLLENLELPVTIRKKYLGTDKKLQKLNFDSKAKMTKLISTYSDAETGEIPIGKLLVIVGEALLVPPKNKVQKKH